MRDVAVVPTTVTLIAMPLTFRADVARVHWALFGEDDDHYRRRDSSRGKAERAGASGIVDLNVIL